MKPRKGSAIRENKVEQYLHKTITALGGTTRKWVSPGRSGVPDRICIIPNGNGRPGAIIFFVEVKTDNGKLSSHQEREIKRLIKLGAPTYVAYGIQGVDDILKGILPYVQGA
ncbi:VRR-NUC domain-containing protein [Candidatus Pacearchaeota archaeon]|nr:VRR-NUC domain-containing protein [Candidatus Pacearchaeota archaeon]